MIRDDIKKAIITAMKNRDAVAKSILGVIKNKIMVDAISKKRRYEDMADEEIVPILLKSVKELEEEAASYRKVGNEEHAAEVDAQKAVVETFLPKMMSEDEIREVIMSLDDKSIPSVMKHFKANYNGKCDMRVVSSVLKGIK